MAYKRPDTKPCPHGIVISKTVGCAACDPSLITEQPKKVRTPEEIKFMFSIRNLVAKAQDAIETYDWIDPSDESIVDSKYMFSMLFKYAKKVFSPVQKIYLTSGNFNFSRRTLQRLQRAAVEAKVLEDTGKKSGLDAPIFIMNVKLIEEFYAKDKLTREIDQSLRRSERKHQNDPGDIAEEAYGFEVDDLEGIDNEEDVMIDPMAPTAPICVYCGVNRTSQASEEHYEPYVDGEGYRNACDQCIKDLAATH